MLSTDKGDKSVWISLKLTQGSLNGNSTILLTFPKKRKNKLNEW